MTISNNDLFPKCSGMIWIKKREILDTPQKEGVPPHPSTQAVEHNFVVSGYCLDMAKEIEQLFAKQSPTTQIGAKGMLVITAPNGFPYLEHRFGEPVLNITKPAEKSYFETFKSYLRSYLAKFPVDLPMKRDFNPIDYQNLANYLRCAAYVPTEQGLIKGAKEFSIWNAQTARLF